MLYLVKIPSALNRLTFHAVGSAENTRISSAPTACRRAAASTDPGTVLSGLRVRDERQATPTRAGIHGDIFL